MADWSKLPYDIIHKLSTYLVAIEDFISFSAVCTSWRSVYQLKQWKQVPQIPFLMFCDIDGCTIRNFFSLCTYKVYKSYLPYATRACWCWGSSLGWFVTLSSDNDIILINPLTRASIVLPPTSSLQTRYGELDKYEIIQKAFVFNKPSENEPDLLVMIIYGPCRQLGFCRRGYSSWISIKDDNVGGFINVSCVKEDRIIALSDVGLLLFVNIDSRAIIVIEFLQSPTAYSFYFPHWGWNQLALVESPSGDLWMVQPCPSGDHSYSFEFIVYSYDFDEKRWIRLSGLGDCAIFFGDNCGMCVEAPGRFGYRKNCIYFVVKRYMHRDMSVSVGVYCMDNRHCETLFTVMKGLAAYDCFPMWVVPTLH